MGKEFSIIILASNNEMTIEEVLKCCIQVSDDIHILLNQSHDGTGKICSKYPVSVHQVEWRGYGATKNSGHHLAQNDWILSLDADEFLSPELIHSLQNWVAPAQNDIIYNLDLRLVWLGHVFRYGGTRKWKKRLFHRNFAKWNHAQAHEELTFASTPVYVNIPGALIHESFQSKEHAYEKYRDYARAVAADRISRGKRSNLLKAYLSSIWRGFYVYILRLGFLDGRPGICFARLEMWYVLHKYKAMIG